MQNIRYARVIKLTHALSAFCDIYLTDTQQGVLDHAAVYTNNIIVMNTALHPSFAPGLSQDAHEYYIHLLNSLQDINRK